MTPLEEYLTTKMLEDPFYHRCKDDDFNEVDSSMFEFIACTCFNDKPSEGLRLAKEKCQKSYDEYEEWMRLKDAN